ncbi:MAG: hypothetical protein U7126_12045 [Microcoleus sp.]
MCVQHLDFERLPTVNHSLWENFKNGLASGIGDWLKAWGDRYLSRVDLLYSAMATPTQ